MTKEDKELLLKDLCTRLPYGVKVQYAFDEGCGTHRWEVGILEGFYPKTTSIDGVDFILKIDAPYGTYSLDYEFWAIKPYLRPMSSMTSKEWVEYCDACLEDEKSFVLAGKNINLPL